MPTKDEHLPKAAHNEKCAVELSRTAYRDWCVTALFYSALHYVEMQLAVEGIHPSSHEIRDPIIKKHHLLRNVWNPYKQLNILSRNARYYSVPIEDDDVRNARTWLVAIKTYLKSIGHKV